MARRKEEASALHTGRGKHKESQQAEDNVKAINKELERTEKRATRQIRCFTCAFRAACLVTGFAAVFVFGDTLWHLWKKE